jgi:hypothetical protein
MDGLGELLTLIGKGGNVAQVAALWFLYQIWRDARKWAEQFSDSQERIQRAIIVSNPETARIFDGKPLTPGES